MSELDKKNDHIERYNMAHSGWINWQEEAERDLDYYLNDQIEQKEKAYLALQNRTGFVFNKVRRFVELLSGFEIKDRHVLKIGGIGIEDDQAAEQHTALIMQQMNLWDGYDVLSDAFKLGSLVTGANLVELFTDRKTDDVNFARLGWNEFLLDPTFSKRNLQDCDFILRGKWLTDANVKKLLPGREKDIDQVKPGVGGRWSKLPNRHRRFGVDMRLYEEEWVRDTVSTRMVIVRDATGRPVKIIPKKQFVREAGIFGVTPKRANEMIKVSPNLDSFTDFQDTVKLRVYVDDELMFDGPNPTGLDDYNHVFVGGQFTPEMDDDRKKIQGLVRAARDPQNAMNKRLNQVLDLVETQLNSLRKMRDGALENPEDAWGSGNGKVIVVKKTFSGGLDEALKQENAPEIPAGLFNLFTVLDRTETEVVGLNTEIFGTEQKEIAGVLAKLRTGNALTGQQGIINGYRQAKRQLGRKLVTYNQINKKPQDIQRYTQEQPADGFYDPDILRYDCTPVEGILSDSQRQQAYAQLIELKEKFPDLSALITFDMLLATGQITLGRKIAAQLKQKEQAQAQGQQMARQLEQQQLKLTNAVTAGQIAKAQEDIADAQESRASTAAKRIETMAKAAKLRSEPFLKLLAEAIKLEQIKTNNQTVRAQ